MGIKILSMFICNFPASLFILICIDREKELYENSKEVVDMTAWFAMMLENTGLTIERANEAALTIQVF